MSTRCDTDEPNAALFSIADLTITGTGALTVNGNSNDGITSKDGLVIDSGTITVTAVDDGIRGKDYLVVNGGTVTVDRGRRRAEVGQRDRRHGRLHLGDGGTVTVTAGDDGADAVGTINVATAPLTVASPNEGLEAATDHASPAAPST